MLRSTCTFSISTFDFSGTKSSLRSLSLDKLADLFLQLEGNASDGTELDSLHKMSGVSGDFVSESLGRDNGDIRQDLNSILDLFVEMEIIAELAEVLLNQSFGGSLDSFGSYSSLTYKHIPY